MTVFTVKTTQYISGSGTAAKLADFDIIIIVCQNNKIKWTNQIGLMSIVGELDVHTTSSNLYILIFIRSRKESFTLQLPKRIYEYKQPAKKLKTIENGNKEASQEMTSSTPSNIDSTYKTPINQKTLLKPDHPANYAKVITFI